MKILHTSDLHFGKRLYDTDLLKDQSLFLNWLLELVKSEKVNALLISGDVFDVANPSSEARKLYYEFLVRVSTLQCRVIITGGNHDSPMVLEAPKELLKTLNIHVIGAWPEKLEDAIIELRNEKNKLEAIIAAVPFLRDRELRKMVQDESYDDRLDAIRDGILQTYTEIAKLCRKKYPSVPAIAMGHLFVRNSIQSESEREIQIGNQAGIEAGKFPGDFSYYALGHLHTHQKDDSGKLVYSGSPYPLSFSEKDNRSQIMLLTVNGSEIITKNIDVPNYRKLIKYSGTLEEVKKSLRSFTQDSSQLETLIELEIIEQHQNPEVLVALETLQEEFDLDNARIVKSRVKFLEKVHGTDELYAVEQDIKDIEPSDVFIKMIESEGINTKTRNMLMEAFKEVMELVLHEQ